MNETHLDSTVAVPVTEVGILGPTHVVSAHRDRTLSPRPLAVLGVLASGRDQDVSRDALIEGVWNRTAPATAPKALQMHVVAIRQALGRDTVLTTGRGYALNRDTVSVDADAFESDVRGAARARAVGDGARNIDLLRRALGRWRGPALADISGFDAMARAAGLDELRSAAEEDLAQGLLDTGALCDAVHLLEEQVHRSPLRERRWELLMVGLYRSGRRADALRAFQRARAALVRDVGIEPGPGLTRTEQMVLADEPELAFAV